jgi:SAM-dependent methyltransferase
MRRQSLYLVAALLLGFGLAGGADLLHGQQTGAKTLKLKLLLPQPEEDFYVRTKVFVDGKEVEGMGEERTMTVTTPKDKDYVLIKAVWETNNYTKIIRPRKVTAKEGGGEIVVNFRTKSDTEKDEFVIGFYPTPQAVVDHMCKMAKVGKDDIVYDLGCGDGRLVVTAVEKFGAKKGIGVDLDPQRIKESKERAKKAGVEGKVEFRVGDVLKVNDLSDANVVLLYMGDDVNELLKPILLKTLKPGSRVVSHRFLMGDDWLPDQTETVRDTDIGDCDVHLWVIKGKKK